MGKGLALVFVVVLAACGGEDGSPTYTDCMDARLTFAEAQAACVGDTPVQVESAAEVVDLCAGYGPLQQPFLPCADGSDFLEQLPSLCDDVPRVCEECSHDFDCNRQEQ